MPLSVCAAFWALLDHTPLNLLLVLLALVLNAWLMLAYLDYYKGVLERHALAIGEEPDGLAAGHAVGASR
jgi:hypothetical protein